jgi:hypothetical protein
MLGYYHVENLLPSVVFQGFQVVVKHEGALGYEGHVGLGREGFLA